ncbi:SDR family NAD(P)-dependent oxidoreductase [Bosea sp. (in: a-proteobacteria)]|uniref:SDR family NAD(P)-dependent oxidoreductase n=1 Tax=Bosea sp. (in: a-proteobacteria) TaxID=1871050 RepID=UPI00262714DB|nr:SDR family NAD(P)-dependent oxidoreductase [Bosea sp. (in: a-proteobacteria)]MCO5089829.1 SDR family oxidoreductase [Bosea sp. (in: a-proteobacteria)]
MSEGKLAGKVAIVTGGASGIGEATARLFACEGAKVVIAGIPQDAGERVARSICDAGGVAIAIETDVSNDKAVGAMVSRTVEHFGGLDIIFNNAGVAHDTEITETTDDVWNLVVDVTLKGVFLGCRHAVAAMRERGTAGVIVNSGSTAALVGFTKRSAYCAAKGGVVSMTRALAIELAPYGIRVNAIVPGATETAMVRDLYDLQSDPVAAKKAHQQRQPFGRLSSVDDIARSVLFLASDDASTMTGTALVVDSGYIAG